MASRRALRALPRRFIGHQLVGRFTTAFARALPPDLGFENSEAYEYASAPQRRTAAAVSSVAIPPSGKISALGSLPVLGQSGESGRLGAEFLCLVHQIHRRRMVVSRFIWLHLVRM